MNFEIDVSLFNINDLQSTHRGMLIQKDLIKIIAGSARFQY
jgi:hypothetical protein